MRLAPIRRGLEAELAQVRWKLAALDRPSVERGGVDEHDTILEAEANEAATRRRADLVAKAARIELALERIADGAYGLCVRCGAEIAPRRLQVMPETPMCLPCKEAEEREAGPDGALRRIPRPVIERLNEEEA